MPIHNPTPVDILKDNLLGLVNQRSGQIIALAKKNSSKKNQGEVPITIKELMELLEIEKIRICKEIISIAYQKKTSPMIDTNLVKGNMPIF